MFNPRADIIFLGSPMIDLIAKVDDKFLNKYNLQMDKTYSTDSVPSEIFEDLRNYGSYISIGGSITNTLLIFRRITDMPETIKYFGSIGKDAYGDIIKNKLKEEQIIFHLNEIEDLPTGKVAVMLKDSRRTLVTDLGASRKFSVDYLMEDKTWKILENAKLLYISAFFIKVCFEAIKKVFELFKTYNKTVAMNLGATFLLEEFPNEAIYMFSHSDLIFGNESEYKTLAKITNLDYTENIEDILIKFIKFFDRKNSIMIVTNGEKYIILAYDRIIKKIAVPMIENIINTNGAGDAFVAGFLAGFVLEKSVEQCIDLGISTARIQIQESSSAIFSES